MSNRHETFRDQAKRELRNEKRRQQESKIRYHANGSLGRACGISTRSYVCKGCDRRMCWCVGGHDSDERPEQHELCDDCHAAYGRRARDIAIGIAFARIGFGPARDDAAASVVVWSSIHRRPMLLWRGDRCVGRGGLSTPHGYQWRFGKLVKLTAHEVIQTEHDRQMREHPERGLKAWKPIPGLRFLCYYDGPMELGTLLGARSEGL